ncbi:MAG: hypothetical protein EZS28_045493, partial [Streblomastix strix]
MSLIRGKQNSQSSQENCQEQNIKDAQTPSRRSGISEDQEERKRFLQSFPVQTACIFFHRFFAQRSMREFDCDLVAVACLFIAGKVEEFPQKTKHIIRVYLQLLFCSDMQTINEEANEYKIMRDMLYTVEFEIMKELEFEFWVASPSIYLIKFASQNCKLEVVETGWQLINDSFRFPLYLSYSAEVIAWCAFRLSAHMYKFSLDKYTRHNEFLRKEENQEQVKKCMISMRENCLIGCQMGHITTKNIKDYFHELWTQSSSSSASQISSESDHNYQIKNLP